LTNARLNLHWKINGPLARMLFVSSQRGRNNLRLAPLAMITQIAAGYISWNYLKRGDRAATTATLHDSSLFVGSS
jgi:hypothetical protein